MLLFLTTNMAAVTSRANQQLFPQLFPQFWLAKSTCIIHYNQLQMTKFGRILCLTRKWHQKCSPLQVKAPLLRRPGDEVELFWLWKKKWRKFHSFQEQELQLELGKIIAKNMAKTASVDNTLLYLLNSSYPTQPHSLIANYSTLFILTICEKKHAIINV